jgi:hypothetical protein
MGKLKYVTYCGLYCRLCSNLARIPKQANQLGQTLKRGGWDSFGEFCMPGFKNFWEILNTFAELNESCQGCRGGCGDPECKIKKCAEEKNVNVCSECEDFPCESIKALARKFPTILFDGYRQKEVGLNQWILEQATRVEADFCYDDICYPDNKNND